MHRKLLSVLLGLGLAAVLGACAEEVKPPEPKTPPAAEKTTPSTKQPSVAPTTPSSKTPSTPPSTPPAKK
jgi:ABC-type uncharacterized transport system auxiliary subunit